MVSFLRKVSYMLVAASAAVHTYASTCSGARNLALCAQFIVPFSDNTFTWETSCGVSASSPDMLMAEQIQFNTGACPEGFTATCCTSCLGGFHVPIDVVLSKLTRPLACGTTGVDCTGPATAPPPVSNSTALPDGWSLAIPCAIDNADRVIEVGSVSYLATTTPASCTAQCAAQGFTFAGVEYGDECYCGTGFLDGVIPPAAPTSDCNIACAGNSDLMCGGAWRMQIYSAE
ncbi:hypothetical protein PHLCEN_2v11571 [Hermanssonia centrifuga]|uniref:WSC domain-containing protein n=1 Tax=Hermanssonia centrifuga TaxID=98765 RepID=A0A2R6NK10_9APHY|nr:hypothetical protein PHLCEN_2v11571 [Hermanssonia centrifuga]